MAYLKSIKLVNTYGTYIFLAGIAFVFLAFNLSYTFNLPSARDDANIYFDQYLKYKNGETSIWEHLFGITLYPHPKLTSRIFAFVSLWMFNGVNFKFFQIIGIIAYSAVPFIMAYLNKIKNPILILILSSLFWIPITNMYWSISITSLPFFYIGSILMFYHHSKQSLLVTTGLAIIVLFSSGQGFMAILCLLGKSIFDLIEKRSRFNNLILIFCSLTLLILWYFTIYTQGSNYEDIKVINDVTILDRICFFIKFPFGFLVNSLDHINVYDSVLICLAFFMLVHYCYMLFKQKNTFTDYIAGLILFMGLIASITRLDQTGYSIQIPNRYVIHSIIFFSCYVIKFKNTSKILLTVLSVLCLIICISRALYSYPRFSKLRNIKYERVRNMLIDNKTKAYIKSSKWNYLPFIQNGLDANIYSLPDKLFSSESSIEGSKRLKNKSNKGRLTHAKHKNYNMLQWRKSNKNDQYLICLGKNDKIFASFEYSNKKSYVLRKKPFKVDFNKCILQTINKNGNINQSTINFD